MEHVPLASGPETSSDSDDSKEISTKKKKRLTRLPLLAPLEEKPEKSDTDDKKQEVASHGEQLVAKLLGDTAKAKKEEAENTPSVASEESAAAEQSPEISTETEMVELSPELSPDSDVEQLEAAEERRAALAYVAGREQELDELMTGEEADPADDANRSFLANLRRKLTQSPEEPTEQAVEEAYAETVAEVDPSLQADAESAEDDPSEYTAVTPALGPAATTVPLAAAPVAPVSSPAQRPPMPPFVPGGGLYGGAGNPGGGTGGHNAYPGSFGLGPNMTRTAANLAPETVYLRDNRQAAANLLLGGVVGYFIGRRRGRIKTEKRMATVQKKLERQVEALQANIADKEQRIQILARSTERPRPVVEDSPSSVPGRSVASRESVSAARANVVPEVAVVAAAAVAGVAERGRAGGTSVPESSPIPAERLQERIIPRDTGELNDRQVLELSANIRVGDTDLKKIYEAKLVSEQGLRNMVREHMEGRDIRRSLAKEFIAKELSFERDPLLRKQIQADAGLMTAGASTTAVSPMGQADDDWSGLSSSVDTPSSADNPSKADADNDKPIVSSGLLTALTLLAFGLAAFAVILSLTR